MFLMHIDTARTWRGGQNQVLVTVLGLRAMGHRAMLVAHPNGELRARAAEGLELLPLAPVTEMDLSAAWRLSRAVRQLRPTIVHAHDPHAVAMAALGLSMSTERVKPRLVASRRVDFHMRGNSFSRWKYRQVDCFICASELIRRMLVGDGIPDERTVTVHEGIDLVALAGTPVYAAAEGVVVGAAPNGRYGNWVRIEHSDTLSTVYGHLMAFAPGIEPGETVVRGELIGFVGSTGRSTGAHLHFELLVDGKPVNPITSPELKAAQLRGADLERFRKQVARSTEEREREAKVAASLGL